MSDITITNSAHVNIRGNQSLEPSTYFVDVDSTSTFVTIQGNQITAAAGTGQPCIDIDGNHCKVDGNVIDGNSGGAYVYTTGDYTQITNNILHQPPEHGIYLNGAYRCNVSGNTLIDVTEGNPTTNTYDGILLAGNSDYNRITNNSVFGATGSFSARYGINVSEAQCDCNVVVGNNLSEAADFGTDAINDSGSSTWLTHAGDGTYGDNWVGCPPAS